MKKMNFHFGNVTGRMLLIGTASLFTASLCAQPQQPAGSAAAQQPAANAPHHRHHAKPVAATPKPEEPPVPKVLPSLFDQPAQPATISLSNGTLTIHADNSSLTAILQQVSTTSGMHIEGLSRDQRIFGVYGPGDPHAVISSLLNGSGYNIVMLGQTADGAPRQLTLTPRNAAPAGAASRPMNSAAANADEDAGDEDTQPQQPEPAPEQPQPASERPTPNSVRTPQQMMQELQQMRQQQMQQQQQQQQQTPDNAAPPQ
ncbi:hypothetical protein [Silvibacterium acidisoli]|uniref:hypothetical protein n=1 Tax=Acidobacteriaceae bacterium ZG23-2 TaxID=2883246 RepID=UPI00406C43F2